MIQERFAEVEKPYVSERIVNSAIGAFPTVFLCSNKSNHFSLSFSWVFKSNSSEKIEGGIPVGPHANFFERSDIS